MRRLARWIQIAATGAAGALVACGNGDDNSSAVPILDATTSDVVIPSAFLRVANWSPDLSMNALDVCLSPHGMDLFTDPVLAGAFGSVDGGGAADAGALGVAFLQVSAYVPVRPGSYDIRFVTAGASDCTVGIGPDLTVGGTLASGTLTTVAIFGLENGDPLTSLRTLALGDDGSIALAKPAIRFINALPALLATDGTTIDAPSVDFGTGATTDSGAGTFKPIYVGVPFGGVSNKAETQVPTTSATASVDSHGYGSVNPLVDTMLTAHQSGMLFDLANTTTNIAGGAAVTAVLLPLACGSADASCPYAAELALYVDNAGTLGQFSSCITCTEDGGP